MASKQKITTFLWFDSNAEEAMKHYVSIFKNSKILSVTRNGKAGPGPAGTVLVGSFQIEGQEFTALNGGPQFKFTEAISLVVDCDSQKEVDDLWAKLSKGGAPGQCGWLKDKFGLSWQVVPKELDEMISDKDKAKAERTFTAMLGMKKLDVAALKRAYDG